MALDSSVIMPPCAMEISFFNAVVWLIRWPCLWCKGGEVLRKMGDQPFRPPQPPPSSGRPHAPQCHAHRDRAHKSPCLRQSGAIPCVAPFFRLLIVTTLSLPYSPSIAQLHHQNGKPNKNHAAPAPPRPAPRRGHCLDGADAAATPAGKHGEG